MPSVVCLSGFPGVGKTTRRKTMSGTQFDISDVYDEFEGIDPSNAFGELMTRMVNALKSGEELIVLEAMFAKGSQQRAMCETLCGIFGASIEYIELYADDKTCIERITHQYTQGSRSPSETKRYLARLKMFRDFSPQHLLDAGIALAQKT